MTDYPERRLDHRALEHLKGCLEEGHTLARNVLEAKNLTRGRLSTFLPSTVPEEAVYRFTEGGKLPPIEGGERIGVTPDGAPLRMVPVPQTRAQLVRLVQQHLAQDPRHVAVFEDPYAKRHDPFLTRCDRPYRCFDEEVYYWSGPPFEHTQPQKLFIPALRTLIGVLTMLPSVQPQPAGLTLTANVLAVLAQQARHVLVGAYDGESFVLWTAPEY